MALHFPGTQRLASGKRSADMGVFTGNMLGPNPKRPFAQSIVNMNDNRAPGRATTGVLRFGDQNVRINVQMDGRIPPGETDNGGDEDSEPVAINIVDMHAFNFGVLSILNQMTLVAPRLSNTMFGDDGPFRPIPILSLTDSRANHVTGDIKNDACASVRWSIASINLLLAHLRNDRTLPSAEKVIEMLGLRFIGFSYLSQVAGAHGKRNISERVDDTASNVHAHGVVEHAMTGVNLKSADTPFCGGRPSFIILPNHTDVYLGLVLADVPNGTTFDLDDSHHHTATVSRTDVHALTWQLKPLFNTRIPTREDLTAMDNGYIRRTTAGGVTTATSVNRRHRTGAYTKVGTIIEINEGTHYEIDIGTSALAPPQQETHVIRTDLNPWVCL